jgi:hypothetical protein
LGKSNKISVSLDKERNVLLLDFRGIFKTEFADGVEDRGREAEAGKLIQRGEIGREGPTICA